MRFQLFEFGDQKWLPQFLRDAETAYLAAAYTLLPLPREWARKIASVLRRDGPEEVLDLCSGSGGPIPLVAKELQSMGYDVRVRLSDRFPSHVELKHAPVTWLAEPVDATRVPPEIAGVRTMFSAFHHFSPKAARAILKDAFDRGRAICIFEAGSGTPGGVAVCLLIPLNVLLLMPFARPFRLVYFVFTYLLPVIPLMIFWDGMVSMLRIYTAEQMKDMTTGLESGGYAWEIGRMALRGMPGGVPYLIGRPPS